MKKYQFNSFLKYKNIRHGISSKAFGSMKREDTLQTDRKALSSFAQSIGISSDIVCMGMIHSGNVTIVEDLTNLKIQDTDSLITNKINVPLAVSTADCLPILFFDPEREVIGIAHAGYKGLLNHIIENTVNYMVSNFHSNPKDIIVGIGPSIETKCYEVGVELIENFQETFPSFEDIFIEKDQKYFLDLRWIAQQCLIKEGILKKHVEVMDACTKCDSNFYSNRGGDGNRRFVSVISLQ